MHISPVRIRFTYKNKKSEQLKKTEVSNPQAKEPDFYLSPYQSYFIKPNKNQSILDKGQVVTKNGQIINRHTTEFCRSDLDWAELGRYLKNKYPSINDTDFLVFASSTGEEPYTLAILLNDIYGDISNIKAFDISQDIIEESIEKQKEGITISAPVCDYIFDAMQLKNLSAFEDGDYKSVKLRRNITDSVSFEQANILTGLDKIDSSKPSVIFARNMWPYVNPIEYGKFAKELYEKLASNSIFVIGLYDYEGNPDILNSYTFPDVLLKEGFKRISYSKFQPNAIGSLVFEKE